MKTYHYEFTEYELYALREALDMYYFELKRRAKQENWQPNSPIAIKTRDAAKPLLEQFNKDIRLKVK